jgi:lipopolysaccharide/colanic/teichoic acid biosynthesis glycosyltransferase
MTTFEISHRLSQRNRLLQPVKFSYKHYRFAKRVFDLTVCFLLLPFLLPFLALISLAIIIESPGSPIFVQERVGFGNWRFKMYKFRSMWSNHTGAKQRTFMQMYVEGKISDDTLGDERVAKYKPLQPKDITKVGRLLRKTSLDELPQIFNVIKGEMSLIGPRPNVLWEVEVYKPWHFERLQALPGITGLAQVMGRSDISFDEIARYDIQYVKNQALYLDFWIVWQSIKAIIGGNGAG